jgi:hypothetical protein
MWFTSSKNLTIKQIDKLLRQIKSIDSFEREYIKGLFRQYESGGITSREVEEAVRDMRLNTSDQIDRQEAKAVKEKLLKFLE